MQNLLKAAVAVLLAAPATVLAQTVSFSETTGVVQEDTVNPVTDRTLAKHYRVTVTKSADVTGPVKLISNPPWGIPLGGNPALQRDLDLVVSAEPAFTVANFGDDITVNFNAQNQAVLTITQANEPWTGFDGDNWDDNEVILALQAPAGTRIGPPLRLTLKDRHAKPTATFSKTSMRLTEDSTQEGVIKFDYPAGATRPRINHLIFGESISPGRNRLRIQVQPPGGIGTPADPGGGLVEFKLDGQGFGARDPDIHVVAGMPGRFTLPMSIYHASTAAGSPFTVKANPDMAEFRNQKVTISFVEFDAVITQSGPDEGKIAGPILAGPPLVVEILSDEEVPTVCFTSTDIGIREGGQTTAVLASKGKQSAEVNTIRLAVDGDAMVDLYLDATKLEPAADGLITVKLKDVGLARLTARSTSDRSLMDGQLKSKTWRIKDADGANVDTDANRLTVTVQGSTAVPVLPLLAQLLLALCLAAGGSRLYRRR